VWWAVDFATLGKFATAPTDKQRPNPIIKVRLPHKASKQLLESLWFGISFHLPEVLELAEVLSSRDV
jgi:hypothetical protein